MRSQPSDAVRGSDSRQEPSLLLRIGAVIRTTGLGRSTIYRLITSGDYVEGFGLSEAEYAIVRSRGSQGGRRLLVKQVLRSALCELDLSGLENLITVLSATTDNIAMLDELRAKLGDDPAVWLPALQAAVRERRSRH